MRSRRESWDGYPDHIDGSVSVAQSSEEEQELFDFEPNISCLARTAHRRKGQSYLRFSEVR